VKDCDVEGPEICRTEYETICRTKQEVHEVEEYVVECKIEVKDKCKEQISVYTTYKSKYVNLPGEVFPAYKKPPKKFKPVTGCIKEPSEIHAPAGCGFKEGLLEGYDKSNTIIQDISKYKCSLQPQRTCKVFLASRSINSPL
jgi:hypothetical protein